MPSLFDYGRRALTTAATLFGRPWGIPRPRGGPRPQDGTGTARMAPSPALNPVSPNPPYTPPFQLRDDPPPEANRRQREEEYAAAQVGLAAYYRSLPMWIDDLTRGVGDDLYARMGLDDQIFTSTRNVVRQVLADGLTIRPAVEDKDKPGYAQAKDYAERAERMLADLSAGLPQSMDAILQEALLIAAGMGHKVFELVYEPGRDGWTNLARIKSKPRRSTAFVVNPYNDLVGMLVRLPGMALPALASVTDLRSMPILPFDKFAVLTHMEEDSDPRGNSLWRAAYPQWWEKLQTARDYMRYLGQFAMPSIVGELPERNTDEPATDLFGNVQTQTPGISQTQNFVNALVAWRNGSAMAHAHGGKVYTVFAASTGEAFWRKLDRCDRQIDKVISGQVLAGGEGRESEGLGAGKAGVHQDMAAGNLPYYRGLLQDMLNRQVLRRWLRLNEGDEAAETLCPTATLQKIEEQDRGEAMKSYGALYQSQVLKPSQLPYVHEQLGLPPCKPEELTSPQEDAMALQAAKPAPGGGNGKGNGGKGAEFAEDDEGHWRTIHGAHVFIKDGKITKGPAHLVGKAPSELDEAAEKDKEGPGNAEDEHKEKKAAGDGEKPKPGKYRPNYSKEALVYAGSKGAGKPNPRLPKESQEYLEALDRDQTYAVRNWTEGGYKKVNELVRNPGHPGNTEGEDEHYFIRKNILKLKELFANLKPFPNPVKVVRGMNLDEKSASEFRDMVKSAAASGDAIEFNGFMSTTTKPALDHEIFDQFRGNVVLEIAARKGLDVKPISFNHKEDELLLGHKSKFKVVSVDESEGVLKVKMEQLP